MELPISQAGHVVISVCIGYNAIMRAALHRFLLLMLMLILPMQAFAAASMLGCVASSPVQTFEAVQAGCHDPDPENLPAHPECMQCPLCFLAGAQWIPAPVLVALAPISQVDFPQLTVAIDGFIPDSPERPPRFHLA